MNTFLKDSISVVFSKGALILFGLATSIIIARALGPEKNGIIATILVYPSLFMAFGSLGISQSSTFFLGKKIFRESQIKQVITQVWMLSSVICVIGCFFLLKYFAKSIDNQWYIILALVPIPFSLFNTYNSGIFLGKNQINHFNKIGWIPPLIILFLTVLLVSFFSLDITGYLLALSGGPLVVSIVLLFKNHFIAYFRFSFDWSIIKRMLSLGLIYSVALLVINLNYSLDIILLDYLSLPYETGIYTRGATITQYLWQIPTVLSSVVFARSAVSINEREFSMKVSLLLRISLVVIGVGSLGLYFLSETIIIGMYGEKFRGSITVLNTLLPGVVLLTFFKVINVDLAGKGKPWVAIKAMLPALIVNISLNFFLIPEYGANGAAIASAISYSISALLFIYFYSIEVQIPIKVILGYRKSDFDVILQIIKSKKK